MVGSFTLNWGGPSTIRDAEFHRLHHRSVDGRFQRGRQLAGRRPERQFADGGAGQLADHFNSVSLGYNNGQYSATPNGGFLTNNGVGEVFRFLARPGHCAGIWDSVSDGNISSQSGTNDFINVGTLEKTGGTGTTTIGWYFNDNGGTLTTPSGYFTFNGVWYGNILVRGNATISGVIGGVIASNAAITWLGGDLERQFADRGCRRTVDGFEHGDLWV